MEGQSLHWDPPTGTPPTVMCVVRAQESRLSLMLCVHGWVPTA